MEANFEEIIRRIKSKHELSKNQTPPILVHGGRGYLENIKDQVRFNKQIIIRVNEFAKGEIDHAASKVRQQLVEQIGGDLIVVQPHDKRKEIEDILDNFGSNFPLHMSLIAKLEHIFGSNGVRST